MRLSEFLRSDFVIPDLQGRDVENVIDEVSSCAAKAGVGPKDVIVEKLLERERSHPTVMGSGLAIPHATVPGLPGPAIGVALAREPVEFGPPELDRVRVFFVLLSPPGFEREHVKLLARICRLVRHDNFIDRLENAGDGTAVVRIIESIDALHV
jgi:nitrogen PTS system EIIA component